MSGKNELFAAVDAAVADGVISSAQADAVRAMVDGNGQFGAAEFKAVDWAKIIALIVQLLPVLLPLLLELFKPKPATTSPVSNPVTPISIKAGPVT